MTAQISESIVYKGESHILCSCPLSDYFTLSNANYPFSMHTTACWRGYVGRWEITDGRLYLIELDGRIDKDEMTPAMELLFPSFPERVFAHWFSGTLRIPLGKQVEYVHMGFSSKYEKDLFVKVRQGVVISESIRENV